MPDSLPRASPLRRRAVLSVTRKDGLAELARGLRDRGFELAASGGTARFLGEQGLPFRAISDITGQPEILGGRVKTLHPAIHGGVLARRSHPDDLATLAAQDILPVDVVAVNFYPFEEALRSGAADEDALRETIDIGGPCLARAAAKNWPDVLVAVDPADYPAVLEALDAGADAAAPTRRRLAARAFQATAAYESRIAGWLGADGAAGADFLFAFDRVSSLRYGENPHQSAALYRDPAGSSGGGCGIPFGRQLGGRALSYNNILDLDAALRLTADLAPLGAAAVVIKHLNPAGAAVGATLAGAWAEALATDPVSAFGGIVGLSRPVDAATAAELAKIFLEAVVAPGFEPDALARLRRKRKLRLIEVDPLEDFRPAGPHFARVAGGVLAQDWDRMEEKEDDFRVVTRRAPTDAERAGLRFAWRVARHVRSNAIVIARDARLLGVGAGQMSRLDSCRLAVEKARSPLQGGVAASDAFFPFRDGLDALAAAGVRAVIQPGGSVRDEEAIAAADEHDMAMGFTGVRHFRH